MRFTWSVFFCGLLFLFPLLSSCKQGVGDRCQLDSDCENELVCCVSQEKRAAGGKCYEPDRCDLAPADSGPADAQGDSQSDAPRE